MTTRADLHKLVDTLPDSAIETATELVRRIVADPDLAHLYMAPWDGEPLTARRLRRTAPAWRP